MNCEFVGVGVAKPSWEVQDTANVKRPSRIGVVSNSAEGLAGSVDGDMSRSRTERCCGVAGGCTSISLCIGDIVTEDATELGVSEAKLGG
jgi:hypothetical protein